jgi:hypothetical protein
MRPQLREHLGHERTLARLDLADHAPRMLSRR